MELNRHICTQLIEKSKSFSQITLDDDYIIRDNKPDVIRIIYSKGDIFIEDVKSGNQGLWITGKLRFSTLYQSDDEAHRLDSVTGEVPFQEKIVMDETESYEDVTIHTKIEDLSVGIINSRKLVIRAVVNVSAKNLSEEDTGFVCSVTDAGYEQKQTEFPMLCLVENTQESLRMQREIMLPNARSNIGQLTFYQVDFRNEEITLQDDSIQLKMDAQVWILYRSESTGEYECYEASVPLNGEFDTTTLRGDEIFWAKIKPIEVEVEPRSDYDGENRMLGLDMIFSVELQIYREETCQLLQDTYALDKNLILQKERIPVNQLLVKNISKIRLMEQEQLEPNEQKILQICGSSGDITIDSIHKRENGLHVEGILNVHILYNTTDDSMPFSHTSTQIPFEQFIEIDGFTENSLYWINESIEQLQVNLLESSEYEVKAIIQIAILVLKQDEVSNIISIEQEDLDMDTLQKQPGMIGYVRREGEDLWDVAKKYHTTTDNMIEIGNKVLVIKQIS